MERESKTEIYRGGEKEGGREKWMKGRNFREGGGGGGGVREKWMKRRKEKREEERVKKEKVRGQWGRGVRGGEREEMVGQMLVQHLKKKKLPGERCEVWDQRGEGEGGRKRERAEICPSLAFQDYQLIVHLSKMQDIIHTNPNCVLHFIQIVQNYFTLTKICY